MRRFLPYGGLLLLLGVYLALALAYGAATPDFEAPDAGGHWKYIAALHERWALPTFTAESASFSHELVQQPPLYYALVAALLTGQPVAETTALVQRVVNPYYAKGLSQRATYSPWNAAPAALRPAQLARGVTLAGGLLTVLLTWLLVRTLLPRQGFVALAAASVVALNPQFLFMSTAITNDIWAAALATGAVWVAVLAAAQPRRSWYWLAAGLLCGLATATKYSGLFALLPAAVLLAWGASGRSWRARVRAGLWLAAGFLAIGAPLFWHNWQQTGELIPTVAMQQLLPGLVRPAPLAGELLWEKVIWLVRTYTGVFGYGIPAPAAYFWLVDWLLWLGGIGLGVMLLRWVWRFDEVEARAAVVAATWFGGTLAGLLAWVRTMQASEQGRLLFVAAAAVALLLVLGWRAYLPRRWSPLLAIVPIGMAGLGIWQLGTVQGAYALPAALSAPLTPQRPLDARFEGGMRVLGVDFPGGATLAPGLPLTVTVYFDAGEPIQGFNTLFLHLADPADRLLYQYDGVPFQGRHPTPQWRPDTPFAETFVIPAAPLTDTLATLSLGFYPYDAPGARLVVRDGAGVEVGDRLTLANVRILDHFAAAPLPAEPVAAWQAGIALQQADLQVNEAGAATGAGLVWHASAPVQQDYTVFFQALDAGGRVLAQVDRRPQEGRYPTSTWRAGAVIADSLTFPTPATDWAQVIVGLYDASGQRLPLADAGGGDYYAVATKAE